MVRDCGLKAGLCPGHDGFANVGQAVSPNFQAVLRHIGDEIHLAIRPGLTDDRLYEIYDIAVRLVEAGLRGSIHRRDGLDGSSLFLIDPTHHAGMDRL